MAHIYIRYLLPHSVQGDFETIRSTILKLTVKKKKRLVVEQNKLAFGTRGYLWDIYGISLILSVEGHFEGIQCACLKMSCTSKKAEFRPKLFEIWDSEVIVNFTAAP